MEHVTESTVEGIRRLSCHTPTLDAIPAVASLRRVALCSVFMAPRRDRGASKALGKRPAQASQDGQAGGSPKGEVRHRPFHFGRRIPKGTSSISSRGRAFYSRVTFGHGGPITSTVRGVQIHLDPESICRILDIPPGGLRVYDAKTLADGAGFRSERGDSEDLRPCRCPRVGQTIGP
ncbi:hypothetical protein CK203_060792 [Vitis vinifera]|uniref:Uncharacterized protein n=1 Tax=Vitis vinifera TaxID=29760 RepID=A0A438FUQ6_VITVI|nr:hypothetical protein CK203_060792 [Vitis vinifera]